MQITAIEKNNRKKKNMKKAAISATVIFAMMTCLSFAYATSIFEAVGDALFAATSITNPLDVIVSSFLLLVFKTIIQCVVNVLDIVISPINEITTMKMAELAQYLPFAEYQVQFDEGEFAFDYTVASKVNDYIIGIGVLIWILLSCFAILMDFYYVASGDKRAVPGSKLFVAITVTGVLTYKAQDLMFFLFDNEINPIVKEFLDIAQKGKSGINIFENIGSSLCASWQGVPGILIALVMVLMIGINYIKLALEMVQRYLIVAVICVLSPLAFATGSNQETIDISKKWFRMFWSQCVLLFLNVWCVYVVREGMMAIGDKKANQLLIWGLIVYGFIKVAQQLDDLLQNAGLSITRQASGMLEDFLMMGKSMIGLASTAATAAASGFQFKQDSANLREGLANGTKTMDDYKRHKYFRKSYKNAATRANNKYDDLVDEDALTQQALDDGIESSDYVKFVTNNMTTDDNKGFQRVSFYIMALDSYKYTTSNDETQEDADTERLKRMIKKAKEISPNGLLDDAITALSALGINIDLGSDKLWVVSTDTTYDDVQDVVGYETIKEWVVDEYDKNGKPVKGHEEDTGEIDPQRPIMKMVRTYTTTISLELNSNIRNSLYESYGIDPAENIGDHSNAFKSTEDPNYTTTEDLNGKVMTAADIIEQQVEQYMEVYKVPRTAGGTGTEIGTIGPGGSGQVSNMSDEEIQAILAALNSGDYTPKQQALVSKLQDALNSPLGLTGYMKSIGCTVATNMCQAFVADFYSKCGQARISFGSAINAYNTSAVCKKGQQGYDTPPDGASVYIGANHVGIYIGGCVIDSVYGQIQVMPFEKWKSQKYYQSGGGYLGWGFNGWDVSS